VITKICRQCNEPFHLEPGEIRFYEERQWPPPERCPVHRNKRKNTALKVKKEAVGEQRGFTCECGLYHKYSTAVYKDPSVPRRHSCECGRFHDIANFKVLLST
jgi:hypothetical protein